MKDLKPFLGHMSLDRARLHQAASPIRRVLCRLGLHAWDGHTGPDYPVPRCRGCGTFFDNGRRKREEKLGWHRTVYFTCVHREDWDDCTDCRH